MMSAYVILAFVTALNFFLVFILYRWAKRAQSAILATADLARVTHAKVLDVEKNTQWLTNAATDDHK